MFIIKWDQKGWFKALGLHHGLLAIGVIFLFHLPGLVNIASIGFGEYGAGLVAGWYLQREWGNGILPRKPFEILDFATPFVVGIIYLIFI